MERIFLTEYPHIRARGCSRIIITISNSYSQRSGRPFYSAMFAAFTLPLCVLWHGVNNDLLPWARRRQCRLDMACIEVFEWGVFGSWWRWRWHDVEGCWKHKCPTFSLFVNYSNIQRTTYHRRRCCPQRYRWRSFMILKDPNASRAAPKEIPTRNQEGLGNYCKE